jgi:hypothetical protein
MDIVLHAVVSWSSATLGTDPVNVLAIVLDVAGLAVDTVLCVNHQTVTFDSILARYKFIDTCEGKNK